jgi:hypothetical protein
MNNSCLDYELVEIWSQLPTWERWHFRFRVRLLAFRRRHPITPIIRKTMLLYLQWACLAALILPMSDKPHSALLAGASVWALWQTQTIET